MTEARLVALIAFFGGILLGLAARIGRFCTLGAIEDALYQNSDIRLRMWGTAIGVAGLCAFGLISADALYLNQTLYFSAPFAPLAHIIGGLLFGYGMSLAGNCGFGALARFGGGDLRSFVIVVVLGLSAYAALSGPLAYLRVALISSTELTVEAKSYAQLLANLMGSSVATAGLIISGAILAIALASRQFLSDRSAVFWGAVVGIAVASGWAGTQWIASHGFNGQNVMSHSFSAPLGNTMLYLMTSSGTVISFGVGSVFGVLSGAFIGSLIKGHFRWEACEDPRELKRQILGAVCMGFGAVLALGCTVGQGISAFSLLYLGAPITFLCILIGAAFGLRQLIEGIA